MEVMNPVNFQRIQEQIKDISKEFFSYSTSINTQDFGLNEPPNGLRRIEQENIAKTATIGKNLNSRFLIVWGCGEFGQHGLDQSGDVAHEMALSKFKSGDLMLPNDRIPLSTVCGSSHTLVLTGDRNVYSWGNGTSGQLGNGKCNTTKKPTLIPVELDSKIQGISCGARHSFIWTENGYCYSFGNNFNAQLGYNFSKVDFKENQLEPVLVEFLPDMKVMEVACGARHSLFLLKTGHVMAVGCNQHGQIGNDTTEDVIIPAMLDDLNSITHVACGNIHSLASHENGTVYAWGYGKAFGNKTRHVVSPQKSTPQHIDSYSAVVSLSGGDSHSMVLYDNGELFTWGNNYEGQLGVGKDVKYQNQPEAIPSDLLPRPVKQIACGETTSAAITGKGQLFMWGKNAGLIRSDKPSQYFQYLPHHIEMGGLVVTQISCGAWHVSAIINSASEIENSSCNHNNDSLQVEKQPTLMGPELNLEKNGALVGAERDNVSFTDANGHRLNDISLDERLANDDGDSLMDTCFITKWSSHSEMINHGGNNNEIAGSDIVKEKQEGAPQEVCFDQKDDSCLVKLVANSSGLFHSNDKTVERIIMNETKGTKIMHSVGYHNKETLKDLNLTRRQDNEFQIEDAHHLEKLKDPFNTNTMRKFVSCDEQEKLTVGLSQNKHLSYTSEDIPLQKDKGNDKSNVARIEKVSSSHTVGSQNVCSKDLEFDMENFILEKDRRKKNSSQDKCEDFRKDDGVEASHLVAGDDLNVGKRKGEWSLPNYCDSFGKKNSYLKDDQFLSINEKFEAETIENQKTIPNGKAIDQWHNIQDLCEKNSTPVYVGLHKKPSSMNKHTSSVMSLYSSHQICLFKHKSEINAVTPAQNKDTNVSQVFTQQQAVPVIDLRFGSRQAEESRIKPGLTAFTRKVWKASTLLREKQRQKNLCRGTSPGSNLKFNLENMLSHRPIQIAKGPEKRTKLKEDSMQELLTKTDKLSKNSCSHCRNRTELLPPICLCKRNGVQQGERDTLTNIFVNRR